MMKPEWMALVFMIANTIKDVVTAYKKAKKGVIDRSDIATAVWDVLEGMEFFKKGITDYGQPLIELVEGMITSAVKMYNFTSLWGTKYELDKIPDEGVNLE